MQDTKAKSRARVRKHLDEYDRKTPKPADFVIVELGGEKFTYKLLENRRRTDGLCEDDQ